VAALHDGLRERAKIARCHDRITPQWSGDLALRTAGIVDRNRAVYHTVMLDHRGIHDPADRPCPRHDAGRYICDVNDVAPFADEHVAADQWLGVETEITMRDAPRRAKHERCAAQERERQRDLRDDHEPVSASALPMCA